MKSECFATSARFWRQVHGFNISEGDPHTARNGLRATFWSHHVHMLPYSHPILSCPRYLVLALHTLQEDRPQLELFRRRRDVKRCWEAAI